MQVRLESKQDGLFRFKVNGRLTTQTLRNLDDPLDAMGDVVYRGMVLFDMVDAEFLDSSGINWLLQCHKRCDQAGGRLVIHSIPSLILNVLMVVRMNDIFDTAENEVAAITLAQQPRESGEEKPDEG